MITVRGNNVFPAGVEAIIRRFEEVAEFRVTVTGTASLAEVEVEVEPVVGCELGEELGRRVGRAIQDGLSFRAGVRVVACGSLPRFEMKARRFVRRMGGGS
jgi:phenylacetate-CoA ligase